MRTNLTIAVGVVALAGAGITTSSAMGANLVLNGDFETPSLAGINSDYLHTPGGNSDEGTWWVSPWNPGGPWHGTQHTPGGVAAMSVNGDDSTQAGVKRVWYQTIAVTPGTQYEFSAWMLATASGFQGYSLQFAFDGVQIGNVNSPTAALVWESFDASFIAANPSVTISIVNVSGITFPNDFMIDDIALVEVPTPGGISAGCAGAVLLALRRRRR
jgi:hypothetical protein